MTAPAAKGERFIAISGETLSILDIAKVLRRELGAKARRVPRFQAPDWLVRLAANADSPAAGGRAACSEGSGIPPAPRRGSLLGWHARSNDEAILATAESLIRLGLVKG